MSERVTSVEDGELTSRQPADPAPLQHDADSNGECTGQRDPGHAKRSGDAESDDAGAGRGRDANGTNAPTFPDDVAKQLVVF